MLYKVAPWMKCVIIDDEAKSRTVLHRLCENYCSNLEVVGLAASVVEGIHLIDEKSPDLVFLDIRMPKQSGFSLLEHYGSECPFAVVFTSAYDEYAFQAFKYMAVDYLQKPINIEELVEAVGKVQKSLYNKSPEELRTGGIGTGAIDKIALTTIEGYIFVRYQDIIRCEAQGNYTAVYLTNGQSLLITKTLKYYEDILIFKGFFRVHKSHLINLHCVRKFIKGKQNLVEMTDGKQIEVSFRRREALLHRLEAIE